ncbi:hypothetical protein CRUP_027395 [Coryphaenoides rupestris]|nr:hypothetical protein CRUP_027395 [Coryphaenoides rupestris]
MNLSSSSLLVLWTGGAMGWTLTADSVNASALPCSSGLNGSYSAAQTAAVVMATTSLSLVTALGNGLVMLSIGLDRRLRTVHNYFLFSLAVADLVIGLVSVNLYALYVVHGRWPLGALLCDLWLMLDYVVSNASVMNLLLISLDRYFCVTRPLSYPARRTGGMACLMISGAWLLSVLLWAPPILCWQVLPAQRPVPEGRCYVQVLASPAATLGTSLASFYLPATAMLGLYARIAARSATAAAAGGMRRGMRRKMAAAAEPPPPRRLLESRSLASSESETKTTSECLTQTDSGGAPKPEGTGASSTCSFFFSSSSSSPLRNPQDSSSREVKEQSAAQTGVRGQPGSGSMLSRWQESRRDRVATRERRVTHTVLAVLTAFILTWTPYSVLAVVGAFCRVCVPSSLWAAGYWMCYVNSAINPGLYALFNGTFRKTFLRLLHCRNT